MLLIDHIGTKRRGRIRVRSRYELLAQARDTTTSVQDDTDSLASLASLLAAVARTPRVPPILPGTEVAGRYLVTGVGWEPSLLLG